ncbi:hypothetical protein [Rhodopseudomonas sp. B29]|uniref:hypothetical protein n=1 Tax=Rhodopseudomonas sp. B29 TaxID=95607 RepID=UPI00034BCD37|nr:hypothetical protein [Rhodopseudomonas sp. B29]
MNTLPTPSYIVICAHHAGGYLLERNNLTDLSRSETITDIVSGEIDPKAVCQIIEIDLDAGTSRDATKDIARAVMTRWADRAEPLSQDEYEFVESFVSIQAANSFRRAA